MLRHQDPRLGGGRRAQLMCSPQQRHFGVQLPREAPEAAHALTDQKKIILSHKGGQEPGAQGSQPRLGFITQRLAQPGAPR